MISRPVSTEPATPRTPTPITTAPTIVDLAARTIDRRGIAPNVVRIIPVPYSALMTSTARTATTA
jgi:hypothetical protein